MLWLILLLDTYTSAFDVQTNKNKHQQHGFKQKGILFPLQIAFSMDTNAIGDPDCPFPAAITATLQGLQALHERPWSTVSRPTLNFLVLSGS